MDEMAINIGEMYVCRRHTHRGEIDRYTERAREHPQTRYGRLPGALANKLLFSPFFHSYYERQFVILMLNGGSGTSSQLTTGLANLSSLSSTTFFPFAFNSSIVS